MCERVLTGAAECWCILTPPCAVKIHTWLSRPQPHLCIQQLKLRKVHFPTVQVRRNASRLQMWQIKRIKTESLSTHSAVSMGIETNCKASFTISTCSINGGNTNNFDNEGNQTITVNIPEDNSIIPRPCWEQDGFICCFVTCAELTGSLTVASWINPLMVEWSPLCPQRDDVIWLLKLQMIRAAWALIKSSKIWSV